MESNAMGKFYDAIEKAQKNKQVTSNIESKNLYSSLNDDELQECLFKPQEKLSKEHNNFIDIDKRLVTIDNSTSFEAEQIRILKTNILNPRNGKIPRSILVTSAVPYEGKSFIAANLAISLAQSIDQYSLLVDCDLRMPTVHHLFGYRTVPGLSDCLNRKECISNLLLKTNVQKLSILPAGNIGRNPSELLSSKDMVRLISEVTERYNDRFIILDSPPPSLASETKSISSNVDGIILVVKLGSTRRELVLELIETLGREKIIGIVVNWFDVRSLLSFLYGKYSKYERYYRKYRTKSSGGN